MIFITADAVAELSGFSCATAFLSARRRLVRDHGFPAHMPTCLRPMKWRKEAVQAWTDMQGGLTPPPDMPLPPNVVLLDEARRV